MLKGDWKNENLSKEMVKEAFSAKKNRFRSNMDPMMRKNNYHSLL